MKPSRHPPVELQVRATPESESRRPRAGAPISSRLRACLRLASWLVNSRALSRLEVGAPVSGVRHGRVVRGFAWSLTRVLVFGLMSTLVLGQDSKPTAEQKKADTTSSTTAARADTGTPPKAEAPPTAPSLDAAAGATNQDASAKAAKDKSADSDEIQFSLQGANIEMVVQWLAQTTGKTVIKHPRVQCQLTITSSKKLTKREAITLVYRALSLEGFTATESSNAILITPEGQEPKMSPELVGTSRKEIPEGRQRLVKTLPARSHASGRNEGKGPRCAFRKREPSKPMIEPMSSLSPTTMRISSC